MAAPKSWGRGRAPVAFAALGVAVNAFSFMNFSAVAQLSGRVLRVDVQQVSWLYSASLLSVLPAFLRARAGSHERGRSGGRWSRCTGSTSWRRS